MKKFIIAAIVLVVVGGIFKGPSAPLTPQIPMQILEKVEKGSTVNMSVVVPDSVENNEANLRNVGERIIKETQGASHVFVDIFTNVTAYKVRKAIMANVGDDLFEPSSPEKADYYQHFLAQYSRNSTTGYHQIAVNKENVKTLPKKITF